MLGLWPLPERTDLQPVITGNEGPLIKMRTAKGIEEQRDGQGLELGAGGHRALPSIRDRDGRGQRRSVRVR